MILPRQRLFEKGILPSMYVARGANTSETDDENTWCIDSVRLATSGISQTCLTHGEHLLTIMMYAFKKTLLRLEAEEILEFQGSDRSSPHRQGGRYINNDLERSPDTRTRRPLDFCVGSTGT